MLYCSSTVQGAMEKYGYTHASWRRLTPDEQQMFCRYYELEQGKEVKFPRGKEYHEWVAEHEKMI